jgi:hypothetical protein
VVIDKFTYNHDFDLKNQGNHWILPWDLAYKTRRGNWRVRGLKCGWLGKVWPERVKRRSEVDLILSGLVRDTMEELRLQIARQLLYGDADV